MSVATAIGVINGLLVVRLRISAFIATLAMGSVLAGITLFLSGGTVVYQGMPESYIALGRTQVAGFPLPVFYMFAAILIATYVMGYTPFGRYTYALGGGREAARLAGLNTGRLLVGAFTVSGFMAGLAGVVATAAIGAAHPDIGSQYLLPVFAACFLGATTIQPGRFNVVGTIVALFLLAVGISGLQQMGAPLWVGPIFNGLALITAVGLAVARGSRQSR
jgi:ribose transport system permease protein